MDRTRKTFLVVTLLASIPAYAGAVLAPAYQAIDPDEVNFPESRFGHVPAKPDDYGVTRGYASRAVTDMDEGGDGETAGLKPISRNPASDSTNAVTNAMDRTGVTSTWKSAHDMPIPTSQSAPTSAEGTMGRRGVQEVSLIAGDLGFFPKTIFVTRDVPVRLFVTGASKSTLCIMMDSFQVRKQVRSQKIEEITFTPGNPGKYRFYCPVNGMEGNLIVKDLVSAVPQGEASASTKVNRSAASDEE